MQLLIEISDWGSLYFNEEGRMPHQGYWQSRLNRWIQMMVLSNNNTNISFLDLKNDDIFKETPLPCEEDVSMEDDTEELNETADIEQREKHNNDIVVFENNVQVKIFSKWVGNIRIIANNNGFYVTKATSLQYARIKRMMPEHRPIGNIWIKRTSYPEWSEIVHFYNGTETCVGYMKQIPLGISYKETLIQQNSKQIIFK
jgi:hypothetical protein